MHLAPEELIDLAEGGRAESTAPHLRSCEVCRQQIAALRAAMSAVVDAADAPGAYGRPGRNVADVPEPSPLFWDHLSRRVLEAVAAEEMSGFRFAGWRWGTALATSWRGWAIAGVAAAVAISIYATTPRTLTRPSDARDGPAGAAAASAPLQPFGAADDPSLTLFADLAEQMDSNAITEAGWSSHVGAVDEVVTSLTEDERLELQRLLNEELAKS
jgi:hypothetical protein